MERQFFIMVMERSSARSIQGMPNLSRMSLEPGKVTDSPITTSFTLNRASAPAHIEHGDSVVYMTVSWNEITPASRRQLISPCRMTFFSCTRLLWPRAMISLPRVSTAPIGRPPCAIEASASRIASSMKSK